MNERMLNIEIQRKKERKKERKKKKERKVMKDEERKNG